MEVLPSLLDLFHTLAWTLIHFLWQGLLIGVLYEVGKRLTRGSTRQQHNLALAALLALLLAPVLTFLHLYGETSLVNASLSPASTASESLVGADGTTSMVASASSGGGFTEWTTALTFLWLVGVALAGLALLRDVRKLRRAVATSTRPPDALLALLDRQIERLGIRRTIRLRLTTQVHSPGVYGLLRPVILLPLALALCLPRDQLETLIAHELAHVRRADYIGNLLAIAARTLLYFHPVVHRVCQDLETARETLCDDMVIGLRLDPLKYARALSKAEEYRQQVPMPLLTATGGLLSLRVRRILDLPAERSARSKDRRAPVLLIAVSVLTIAIAGHKLSTQDLDIATRPEIGMALGLMQRPAPAALAMDVPSLQPLVDRPRLTALAPPPSALEEPEPSGLAAADAVVTSAAAIPVVQRSDSPIPALPATAPDSSIETTDLAFSQSGPAMPLDPAPGLATMLAAPGDPSPAATATKAREAEARLDPLRVITPDYPRAALRARVEGTVHLEYRIGSNGRPTDIRAIGANVERDFIDAATAALSRWRFPADVAAGDRLFVQEFDFRLDSALHPSGQCDLPTGTRVCRRPAR